MRTLSVPHAFQFQSQRSLNMLVSARGLDRRHGGTKLLDDVSFGIEAGERISVVGPTGSGKSLLLRSIAILEPFDAGQVLWNGNPVSSHDACRYRSSVVYVHQRPGAFEGSVESVLRRPFELRIHRDKQFDRDWFVNRLAEVGRDESFLSRSHQSLSGGESQIVALLRAVSLSPVVLLLDEPTAALDQESSRVVEGIVDRWYRESPQQHAFVWVSHDEHQAERVGDRVCRMREGRIIADAS